MVSIVSPSSSIAITYSAKTFLDQRRSTPPVSQFSKSQEVSLANSFLRTRLTRVKTVLDKSAAVDAIGNAIDSGVAIRDRLSDMDRAVKLADKKSLVSASTSLFNAYSTRISIINIQAQISIFLNKINQLVNKQNMNGGNLISSNSPVIHLQTTHLEGVLGVEPQPLDIQGLGIVGLNIVKVGGISEALSKLEKAILISGQRLLNLEMIQKGIQDISAIDQSFKKVFQKFGGSRLPRGSLINIIR